MVEFYRNRGLLVEIEADGGIEDVLQRILDSLDKVKQGRV